MDFQSNSIWGLPGGLVGHLNTNPFAEGGSLYGQGYGTGRQVLDSPPQPVFSAPQPQAARPRRAEGLGGYGARMPVAQPQPLYQPPPAPVQQPTPAPAGPSYTSGINAGPVWGQDKVDAAAQSIANQPAFSMPSVSGFSPASDTSRLLGDIARQNGAVDSLAFSRAAAKTNADQLFNSQQARAQSGIGGGNLLASLNATNLANQSQYRSAIMGLISSLLGNFLDV